ncbi:MAG: minor capsid protein [Bacteroidales bacterium]|nr:minor capsid protein [Bacteroidales bacterium]
MTIDNGGETVNLIHVDFDDDFDDSYYEQAAEQIYDSGGYNPEMLSTQKGSALINETFRVFNTAIDKGLGEEPDPAVSAALRENAFIFSGFKTHAELEQVSQMLTDEKGNIKPFNEFLNDIQSINKDYNHNYLRTEYNQALQAAQMAGKWADFEKNKNFINLQYRTANDERVRASHRILHGTTLPVDDPFWKQYTPPNGWGCRCTVVAVLKDDYPVQDSHGSIAKAESCFKTPKEKMFKENLAEKKRLFPSKHPYLPKGCGECGKTLLAYNPKRLICKACGAIRKLFKKECESKKIAQIKGELKGAENWDVILNTKEEIDLKLMGFIKKIDFAKIENFILDNLKSLNINETQKFSLRIQNKKAALIVNKGPIKLLIHYIYDKGIIVNKLDSIRVTEKYQRKGIGSNITKFLIANAKQLGVSKITFLADKAGGYAWASIANAKNRKSIMNITDERAIKIIDDYYDDSKENGHKKEEPFPMRLLLEKNWSEDILSKSSWFAEIIF